MKIKLLLIIIVCLLFLYGWTEFRANRWKTLTWEAIELAQFYQDANNKCLDLIKFDEGIYL